MATYAANTSVSVEKTKAEIERVLTRYGADQFLTGWDNEGSSAFIAFRATGRHVRFTLPLPKRDDPQFARTPKMHQWRDADKRLEAWEQACRSKWRALFLVIKAKLEAVESGITVFEDEFMAHIVLPTGETVGQFMRPQLAIAYSEGVMPKKLLGLPAPRETANGSA